MPFKQIRIMPDEFSVKLCQLVQRHPELYDIFNESFHNDEVKNNAWQKIAQGLGVQQSKCVIKWKSLKHQYVKAKKESNPTWDLWPFLQFLDDTPAAKSAPKKRKRESTATPMKMEIPVEDIEMPSAVDADMEKLETKTAATRSSRSTRIPEQLTKSSSSGGKSSALSWLGFSMDTHLRFAQTSSIRKETVVTSLKSVFTTTEPGAPLQPVTTTSKATPGKKETKRATTRTACLKRASSAHKDTISEPDSAETGTPLQTVDDAPEPVIPQPSSKLPEAVLPTPTRSAARRQSARASTVHLDTNVASTTRRVNGASSGTPLKAGSANSHGTAMASTTVAMQPEVVLSRIPVLSNKFIRNEKPVALPVASPEKATVSDVARKESPRKAAAASPAPSKGRVSNTPRGRRSMRAAPAEIIPEEEEEDSSNVEPRQPKRPRIEGNGVGADDQADALAGMKFDTALNQKFFKQLQEKFAKLRPEVVSTMKASIFKMLDEAANN
ncbi:nucleolar and coiled-body phosphoprotein 1-like isoform X2 [Dermacentor albipictus]|uniref:nucleolar and coiled-body phosphoprotein 1-like isoform X2 n=1 Tax=Dermacentor albipictus TaxID=60249 RepID=UPI0038FC41B6